MIAISRGRPAPVASHLPTPSSTLGPRDLPAMGLADCLTPRPVDISICWAANKPWGTECRNRVDPHDPLGLCAEHKERYRQ